MKHAVQFYNNLFYCKFQSEYEFTLEDVGRLIGSLMGDFYVPLYLCDDRYRDLDVTAILHQDK